MASGVSLREREDRAAASQEQKERVYGCARCGRGTLPGKRKDFPISTRAALNTGLAKVPCTLAISDDMARLYPKVPRLRDPREREAHKVICDGKMLVHADIRVCNIVKKHSRN